MPKLKVSERNKLIAKAKQLYIKGFDFEFIAETFSVQPKTIEVWAKENNFESAKKAATISISELRNDILMTYSQLKNNEHPEISADQISKLVSALEKLTPNQKSIPWFIEAYQLVTEKFLIEINEAKKEPEKKRIHATLNEFRKHSDSVIDKLYKELF